MSSSQQSNKNVHMRAPCLAALLLLSPPVAAQNPEHVPVLPETMHSRPAAVAWATGLESLRTRIREMRVTLLLGGEHVRRAEAAAIDFYYGKLEPIDRRLDELRVDLAEERASYEESLKRALQEANPEARRPALESAMELRSEIQGNENESTQLEATRKRFSELVSAVEMRTERHERLSVELESTGALGGVGFALNLTPEGVSGPPLDDPAFVQDLIERDEHLARRLMFESDPARYWNRFPFRPPLAALREALRFPAPDLPGRRR